MADKKDKSGNRTYTAGPDLRGYNKPKRYEKRFIPNDYGGMYTVKVPRDLTLEEKIIEKIRERAPKKKMGGIMKAKFGRSIQDPKTSKGESLRDKIKKTLPKTKEGMPVGGKMKKPKPGSYDYQLESTMKPSYKGMRVGGMCRGMGAAIKGGKFGGVK